MAQSLQADPKKRGNTGKNIALWGLLIMLVAGLGGFGVTNFGGTVTKIGSVGSRDIAVDDYGRALKQEIDAFSQQIGTPLTMAQATALGLDRKALSTLVNETALDNEAAKIGLSVGDARLAEELAKIPAFQGVDGKFDRAAYTDALQRNGLTTSAFETKLRESLGRGLLQGAVTGGFAAPQPLVDTIHAYVAERRGFSLLRLTETDLAAPPAAPSDEVLKAFHTENIATFTKAEAKRITYVALLPETLAKDMAVDEEKLKDLYQSRIDEFVSPEKRIVEQLVYPDEAAATAAKARLDAGETFETLVADRGLTLEAIDLGDVSKTDLGAAGDGVFALSEPGVVGPLQSPIGPALYRMNAIIPAQDIPLEEVRAALQTDLQIEDARRDIGDRIEELDDMIAAGATLEEIAKEKALTLATLDYVASAQNDQGVVAYTAFREAADAAEEGVTSDMIVLDDGGLVALRLDSIVPPAPIPFEEARADVLTAWTADATAKALSARAIEIKAAVEGGATLNGFGVAETIGNITRDGQVQDAVPGVMTAVFEMAPGDVRVIDEAGFTGVVVLNAVTPADTGDDASKAMKSSIAAQVQQAIANDAFAAFTNAVSNEAGITLNQNAIASVNRQIP
jgi:peptidyl-prolyl cis-trans isomerase D